MLIYYIPIILILLSQRIYLMLPATLSGVFPSPRPGPYKDIGYAFISTPAAKPFTRQSPRFKENGHPALSLRDIGYAVFYPASPPKSSGWFGAASGRVDWLARPKEQLVEGYKRFLGDRAYWVLGMF
jgi:platelet-activating factor acetylhydrolase